jgi:hypothetical protein
MYKAPLRSVQAGLVLVQLLAAGCGQQSAPSAPRTVSLTCLFTFWLDDGTTATRPGCAGSATTVAAYGQGGSQGWTEVSSAAAANSGSFSLSAPAGDYLLGVKYPNYRYVEFFETAADAFAFGTNVVGRSDAVGASSETIATFNLAALDPWDANDYVELTSSGGSTFKALVYPSGGTSLEPGTTSATVSFDWYGSTSLLPDGTKGDVVYLHQDATRPILGTGFSYQTATQFAQLPASFVVADGTTQSLDVTLGPVQQTGSLSVDWRTSAFEQYRADINPDGTGTQHSLRVAANPHTLSNRPHLEPGTPDMLFLELPPGTTDQNFVGLAYGQFLPSFWVEYRITSYTAALPVTALGATSAASVFGSIGRLDPFPAPNGPVTPVVTPPRSPRIGGLDAFHSPAGVGVTPTVSWSLPALGTPTSYTLQIVQPMVAATGATTFQTIAYVTTSKTSLSIPPGVLQPGINYVAGITAFVKDPDTSDSAPYNLSYPYAFATALVTFST